MWKWGTSTCHDSIWASSSCDRCLIVENNSYYLSRLRDDAFRKHYKIVKTTSTEESIIKKFESQGCFGNFTR